jgi:hypothetical protein
MNIGLDVHGVNVVENRSVTGETSYVASTAASGSEFPDHFFG